MIRRVKIIGYPRFAILQNQSYSFGSKGTKKDSRCCSVKANASFSCHVRVFLGQGRIRQSPLKLAKKKWKKHVRCESYLNTTASWMNRSLTNKQHLNVDPKLLYCTSRYKCLSKKQVSQNPNQSQHDIKTRGKWLNVVAAQKQYSHLWLLRLLRFAWCH